MRDKKNWSGTYQRNFEYVSYVQNSFLSHQNDLLNNQSNYTFVFKAKFTFIFLSFDAQFQLIGLAIFSLLQKITLKMTDWLRTAMT